jgi:hypothetical protein
MLAGQAVTLTAVVQTFSPNFTITALLEGAHMFQTLRTRGLHPLSAMEFGLVSSRRETD